MRSKASIPLLAAALIGLAPLTQAQSVIQPTFTLEPSEADVPSFPPPASPHFGSAVALHRHTAMASIPGLTPQRVAVFTRDATGSWQRTDTLLGEAGLDIEIDGEHALLSGPDQLSVYRLERGTWRRTQIIATTGTVADIELDGHTAAYIDGSHIQFLHFNRHTQRWQKGQRLQPSKPFGERLALANDTLVLSASGAAYVFQRLGHRWRERQTLLPNDGEPAFGSKVATSGDRIAVSAPSADYSDEYGMSNGKVYVFERRGRFWFETQQLQPSIEALGGRGQFGSELAMTATMLAVSTQNAMIFDGSTTVIYEARGRYKPYGLVGRLDFGMRPLTALDAWRRTVLVGVPWDEHGAPWHIGYAVGYELPRTQ